MLVIDFSTKKDNILFQMTLFFRGNTVLQFTVSVLY